MTIQMASRNDVNRSIIQSHGVDGGDDLHKATCPIDVGPKFGPIPSVQTVLVPIKSHIIIGEFVVDLVDELYHLARSQDLGSDRYERRMLAQSGEHRLDTANAYDAVDMLLPIDTLAQNELGASPDTGFAQAAGESGQLIDGMQCSC